MKKYLLLFVVLPYLPLFIPEFSKAQTVPVCSTDVYLQRERSRHMKISHFNGRTYLTTVACCAAIKNDFVIAEDPANGVILDPINGNGMLVPNYFVFKWTNICDPAIQSTAVKDVTWFTSRGQFPYTINSSGAVAIADPLEWPYVTQYGIPDTAIQYGYLKECNLTVDRSICITKGWNDCYYNTRILDITGQPDGVYNYDVVVNLPPSVHDFGQYPHTDNFNVLRIGDSLYFDVPAPGCCTNTTVTAPAAATVKGKKLSWSPSVDATSYNIYKQLGYNVQGVIVPNANYSPVLITNTPAITIPIPQVTGGLKYAYLVSAVNCFGESAKVVAQ